MASYSVEEVLQRVERPTAPSAEFADALLDRLLEELERPAVEPFRPAPAPRPRQRWTLLAAASVALVVAFVVVASVVFTVTPRPASAEAIVREAIAKFDEVPPFEATVHYDQNPQGSDRLGIPRGAEATVRIAYAGAQDGSFRQDVLSQDPFDLGYFLFGGPGSFSVWDGRRLGVYRADEDTLHVEPRRAFDPLSGITWNAPYPKWEDVCRRGDSEVLPETAIAGRDAYHVRCGDSLGHTWDLWVDRETGLLLKATGELGGDDYHLATSAEGGFEVTDIEVGTPFPPGTFRVMPPAGASVQRAPEPPASNRDDRDDESTSDPLTWVDLRVGQAAPSWTGPRLGGGSLRLADLEGRPSLFVFLPDWCPGVDDACDVLPQVQQASDAWADIANVVWVDLDGSAGAARTIVEAEGYTMPVVIDVGGRISQAWGAGGYPVYVMLDAQGRLSDVRIGPQSFEQLAEMLATTGTA